MNVNFDNINKTLTIKELVITDTELFENMLYFKDNIKNLEYYLISCLKMGEMALKAVKTGENVDFIQKRFNILKTDFNKSLVEYKTELSDKLNDFFGTDGNISKLLSLEVPDSPLYLIKNEFIDSIEKLSLKFENYFAGKKAELIEKDKGPRKGYDYEDQLEVILNRITKPFGDIVIPTQYSTTGTTGKKGDFIIEINSDLKEKPIITIEAKAGRQSMSGKKSILKILDDSIKERRAGVAIAVLKNIDLIPATYRNSIGVFREYGKDKIICIANNEDWFSLDVAYKVARSRLLLNTDTICIDIDPEAIKSKIDSIINTMSQFKGIQGNLTVIVKNIENVKSNIKDLKNSVMIDLNEIQTELNKKTEVKTK